MPRQTKVGRNHRVRKGDMPPSKLTTVRESRQLSLADLARMLDPPTTATQILRLETGERKLAPKWVERIANALGVSEYEIYEDSDMIVSAEERELIERLRGLSPDQRAAIVVTVHSLSAASKETKDKPEK